LRPAISLNQQPYVQSVPPPSGFMCRIAIASDRLLGASSKAQAIGDGSSARTIAAAFLTIDSRLFPVSTPETTLVRYHRLMERNKEEGL
jgi:hypothetical protein